MGILAPTTCKLAECEHPRWSALISASCHRAEAIFTDRSAACQAALLTRLKVHAQRIPRAFSPCSPAPLAQGYSNVYLLIKTVTVLHQSHLPLSSTLYILGHSSSHFLDFDAQ
jgi:hypothetical protein